MLVVTHDPRLVPFADRIVHIEDGKIIGEERASDRKDEGDAPAKSRRRGTQKQEAKVVRHHGRVETNRIVVAALGSAPGLSAADVLAPSDDDARGRTLDRKMWQAVAPGRVEPWSGEIRIGSPAMGRVGEVLVKVNDTVFAGEAMIRLEDDEARNRYAKAELQYQPAQARPPGGGRQERRTAQARGCRRRAARAR